VCSSDLEKNYQAACDSWDSRAEAHILVTLRIPSFGFRHFNFLTLAGRPILR
jgi:hypothetical protein